MVHSTGDAAGYGPDSYGYGSSSTGYGPEYFRDRLDEDLLREKVKALEAEKLSRKKCMHSMMPGSPGMSGYAAAQPEVKIPGSLKRDDFKKVEIKGSGNRYYYNYTPGMGHFEITIEPCFDGFDVGIYRSTGGFRFARGEEAPELMVPKECTHVKEFKNDKEMLREIYEVKERGEETWEKALKIVNDFLRMYKNEGKVKDWGMGDDSVTLKQNMHDAAQMGQVSSNPIGHSTTTTASTSDPLDASTIIKMKNKLDSQKNI